jgi:hypothetical protein
MTIAAREEQRACGQATMECVIALVVGEAGGRECEQDGGIGKWLETGGRPRCNDESAKLRGHRRLSLR